MKLPVIFAALLVVAPVFGASSPKKLPETPAAGGGQAERRHPLRGVITAVQADRSAIMVKHEAIPGVMRAMTMLFRVDAATLKSAKQGQTITALMSRQADEWWLHDVKVVETAPTK
jgi:Cu/Ag efflux protein CusF